jgi:ABC-type antimicrobial peptide transport system permease subunit
VALGASSAAVVRLVLRQSMAPVALGIGLGLSLAFVGSRLLRTLLFGVRPIDPLTFGGVALLLGLVAVLASWVPAERAAQSDPMTALRAE